MNFRRPLGFLLAALALVLGAMPALASTEIAVDGGGWGHGIGMPQYGAKEMAEKGHTAEQILAYFYTGTTFGQVGTGNLVGHAEPLRIGAAQNATNAVFGAVNGPLTLCMDGADDCLTATPEQGTKWSFKAIATNTCQYYFDGEPQGNDGSCNGSIEWDNQPDTRVTFPGLNRTYARGSIHFVDPPKDTASFHVTVQVPLEKYLYGLGEMPSSWHKEALQAQAIAGRTYALWRAWVYRDLETNTSRMNSCGCHLFASTWDQKYIGWAKEAEGTDGFWGDRWRDAVDTTAGKAVIHPDSGGRAIQAYYFSSSGGATENNEDVWNSSPYSYLRSVDDPGATFWTETFTGEQFASKLGFDKAFSATITSVNESGSPANILVKGLIDGTSASRSYTGNQMRLKLGLRSHYISKFSGFLPSSFSEFFEGDFDGDGKDEVAAFSTADGSWWVFERESGKLVGAEWARFSTRTGWAKHLAGDFNGDGKTDLASFHPGNGTWWVSRSTGSGFRTSLWADFSTASGWVAQQVGDFDGDGRDDVAQFHPSNGTWWVSRSTGSGFSTGLWADFSTPSGWGPQLVGDFDGDGRDDIANFHDSNGTWWVSRSTGSGFSTGLWADFSTPSGWGPQLVGDFDGDGRDDIANFHDSNGTWWVSRSTGAALSTSLWTDFTTSSGWGPQLVGDFNGDGRDDIANFHDSNGTWWVSRSTGSALTTSLRSSVSPAKGWNGQLALDLDGDGDDELVNWYEATQVWAIR